MKKNPTIDCLVILAGALDSQSLLCQQLGLSNVFDLFSQGSFYFSSPEQLLKETSRETYFIKAPTLHPDSTVAEIRAVLDDEFPSWKSLRRIVYYPASLVFFNLKRLDNYILKQTLIDMNARTRFEGLALISVFSSLLSQSEGRLKVSELAVDSDVVGDFKSANLSEPTGIFEMSKIQTAARSFNTFESQWPYILKNCSDTNKAAGEYHFFTHVPRVVSAYFPQVGEFFKEPSSASYQIEFLPMFDLSRFLIHGSLDEQSTLKVLEALGKYLDSLPSKAVSSKVHKENLKFLFVEKLHNRLIELRSSSSFEKLERVSQNIFSGGLTEMCQRITDEIKVQIDLITEESLSFSHGDLCFSNILWDKRTRTMKLIDPRGSLDEQGCYLSSYYDLAKLSHSFVGGYDWIMNEGTEFYISDSLEIGFKLKMHAANFKKSGNLFRNWALARGANWKLLRLGEASLFLSMLPLHLDRPDRNVQQIIAAKYALIDADKKT